MTKQEFKIELDNVLTNYLYHIKDEYGSNSDEMKEYLKFSKKVEQLCEAYEEVI